MGETDLPRPNHRENRRLRLGSNIYKVQNPASAFSSVVTSTRCTFPSLTTSPIAHKTKAFRISAATTATPPSSADWRNGSASSVPTRVKSYCSSSQPKRPDKALKPSSTTRNLHKSSPMWLMVCTTCPASRKAKSWCARAVLRRQVSV